MCYNGLVCYFDTRKGESPVESSIIENSHRDPVYKITWLHGKTAFEAASTSTDGMVLWWDIRKLGAPTEQLLVEDKVRDTISTAPPPVRARRPSLSPRAAPELPPSCPRAAPSRRT